MTKPTKRCEHCRIGYYEPTTASYAEMVNGQMMVVPRMRANRCDICNHLVYDVVSLGRLEYLIDHPSPEYEERWPEGKRPFIPEQPQSLPTR